MSEIEKLVDESIRFVHGKGFRSGVRFVPPAAAAFCSFLLIDCHRIAVQYLYFKKSYNSNRTILDIMNSEITMSLIRRNSKKSYSSNHDIKIRFAALFSLDSHPLFHLRKLESAIMHLWVRKLET